MKRQKTLRSACPGILRPKYDHFISPTNNRPIFITRWAQGASVMHRISFGGTLQDGVATINMPVASVSLN